MFPTNPWLSVFCKNNNIFLYKDEKAYLAGRKINACITVYEEEVKLN